MDALFVFGHKFIRHGSKIYSPGQFPYAAWKRYLHHFDCLTVFARRLVSTSYSSFSRLNRSDGPSVSFELLPESNSLVGRVVRPLKSRNRLGSLIASSDAVILRNGPLAWQAARLCRKLSTPWAIEVTGVMWEAFWHHGSMAAKLYAPLAEGLSKYWVARAPYALYVTEKTLQNRYPCNDGVTAGISNAMIPEPERKVLDHRLSRIHQKSDSLVFGFAGSLANESKGLRKAFYALKEAQSALPCYEFRIIGPGDSHGWKKLADNLNLRSNVKFSGFLPAGNPVLEWMDEIDIYLHPSFREGLPRSVVEAMSRGCPVLASQAGGIPELLPGNVLHRAGRWKELARHIRTYATDRQWQMQNAKRNFEMSKRYSISNLSPKRREFWGDFLEYVEGRV